MVCVFSILMNSGCTQPTKSSKRAVTLAQPAHANSRIYRQKSPCKFIQKSLRSAIRMQAIGLYNGAIFGRREFRVFAQAVRETGLPIELGPQQRSCFDVCGEREREREPRRRAPSVSWNDNYIYTLHFGVCWRCCVFALENDLDKLIGNLRC